MGEKILIPVTAVLAGFAWMAKALHRRWQDCESERLELGKRLDHRTLLLAKAQWKESARTNGDPPPATFDENISGLLSDADIDATENDS